MSKLKRVFFRFCKGFYYINSNDVGGTKVIDYNIYSTDGTSWYINNLSCNSFSSFQGFGYDLNGYYDTPDLDINNYPLNRGNLKDAGINLGFTKDFLGNAIIGTPDLGAIEYQEIVSTGLLSEKEAELTNIELEGLNNTFLGSEASLLQNSPNPFSQETVINYFLPENITRATLNIYDVNGAQLKSIELHQTGNGKITINGGEFNAGMYMYSLIVDGQVIGTKKMVLTGTKVYF